MKLTAHALLLAVAAVFLSLAVVYTLVITGIADPQIFSFIPVILAICLAGVFIFTAFSARRKKG